VARSIKQIEGPSAQDIERKFRDKAFRGPSNGHVFMLKAVRGMTRIHILATFPSQSTGRGHMHYYEIRLPEALNAIKEVGKYAN